MIIALLKITPRVWSAPAVAVQWRFNATKPTADEKVLVVDDDMVSRWNLLFTSMFNLILIISLACWEHGESICERETTMYSLSSQCPCRLQGLFVLIFSWISSNQISLFWTECSSFVAICVALYRKTVRQAYNGPMRDTAPCRETWAGSCHSMWSNVSIL